MERKWPKVRIYTDSGEWLGSSIGGLEGTKLENLRQEGLGKNHVNSSEMKRNPIPSLSFL